MRSIKNDPALAALPAPMSLTPEQMNEVAGGVVIVVVVVGSGGGGGGHTAGGIQVHQALAA